MAVFEERTQATGSDEASTSSAVYNNPYASLSIQQQRARLPIFKVGQNFRYCFLLSDTLGTLRTVSLFCPIISL